MKIRMKILALNGSLRARSSNGAVLRSALALTDATSATADIAALPHFHPDQDAEGATPPAPVAALRRAVADADAVLVVSPEYAHGVPGVLKNALDWLVSSAELLGKPTAVLTASPSPTGAAYAHEQLRETLRMMSADVVPDACRDLAAIGPKTDPATGTVTDPATLQDLRTALAALTAAATRPTQSPNSHPAFP
ncbi:NADPH-dependent FMN reductase [Streptomyces monomycini]|uniref:NADPH-dependent FMN reductase n=1 Tax=Streptomyces monomycini TaxID=371720 RepID=UPI002449E91E|nr:NAD(P)H-dependent oxidoreductase [Streptomyces monomycini]